MSAGSALDFSRYVFKRIFCVYKNILHNYKVCFLLSTVLQNYIYTLLVMYWPGQIKKKRRIVHKCNA